MNRTLHVNLINNNLYFIKKYLKNNFPGLIQNFACVADDLQSSTPISLFDNN